MSVARTHRRVGHRRTVLVGLAFSLLGLATVAPVAAASSRHAKLSLLQQGMRFYAGKTILFVDPDAAGGSFDDWTRPMAQFMAQYFHATVNVENIPQGSTFPGQDAVADAAPNGLTIGWINPTADISNAVQHLASVDFNPQHEAFLAQTPPATTGVIVRKSSACPWTTFADLVHNTSASDPVTETDIVSSSNDLLNHLTDAAFGIKSRLVTGYANSPAAIQGFIRGDACMSLSSFATTAGLVAAGTANLVATFGTLTKQNPYYKYTAGVPSLVELAKRFPPKNRSERIALAADEAVNLAGGHILFTQGKVPAAEVTALRAAAKAIMLNPTYEQDQLNFGNNPGWVSGAAAKQVYLQGAVAIGRAAQFL